MTRVEHNEYNAESINKYLTLRIRDTFFEILLFIWLMCSHEYVPQEIW